MRRERCQLPGAASQARISRLPLRCTSGGGSSSVAFGCSTMSVADSAASAGGTYSSWQDEMLSVLSFRKAPSLPGMPCIGLPLRFRLTRSVVTFDTRFHTWAVVIPVPVRRGVVSGSIARATGPLASVYLTNPGP